jgi:hypothetical protein
MPALDRCRFTITCPSCSFTNLADLKLLHFYGRIICRGCKKQIALVDPDKTAKKAKARIDREIAKLQGILSLQIKL